MGHDPDHDFAFEPVRGLPEALPPGEEILWQGRPDAWRLALEAFGLGWAAAYATGVVPVDLPPIGVAPPIGDAHLATSPEGIGPGIGLPANDPLATISLVDAGGQNQLGIPPGPGAGVPPAPQQNCQVFCLTPQAQPAAAPLPVAPPPAPFFPPPPPAFVPFGGPPPPAPPPTGPMPGPVN
jgi:hypothetical protein